jgi:prepilin-type processing-associated H-X9-DG protein
MMRRLGIAFAAMVMWLLFGAVVWVTFVLFPLLTVAWVLRDSDWLRTRLTRYGQALDSAANVTFLDGHPKETISSHVGRYYTIKYGNPYKTIYASDPLLFLPWQCVFVKWLTDLAESDHVYHAVEQWALDAAVPL